jgi:hypothetical protein
MLLLAIVLLAQIIKAQDQIDAYVKIIDDNDLAGLSGVYRFTVYVEEAHYIQTFLPEELTLSSLDICRLYLINETETIETCIYDEATNMVQFEIDSDFIGYFVYDLGYLQNPNYSAFLSGFSIQTLTSLKEVLAMS